MATVLDRVRRTITQHHLLAPGETVVIGVSGGPDSLCLLHLLCQLRDEYDLALHVAHLHHGLRGAEADADAEFVRTLAADWGLSCTVECADVPALARERRLAVEEAARRARYAFLSRVAGSTGARTIAVGHNADDQAETVLMHWLRGSGLAGLRGMIPRIPLSDYLLLDSAPAGVASADLALIRPLLEVTRAEIEAYCRFYGLEPRFDRSNLDTTYFRNWLRHEVLPLLARHNPNVREVIRRSARVIADDYALLRSLLEDTWPQVVLESPLPPEAAAARVGREPSLPREGRIEPVLGGPAEGGGWTGRTVFDLAAWRALPTSLQRSTLREAIHRLRRSLRNISFLHVEHALLVARDGTTGDQATLPCNLMLTVGYDRFTIADAEVGELLPDWPLLARAATPLEVRVPGETLLPGCDWLLTSAVVSRPDLPLDWEANTDPWRAYLDIGVVSAAPVLRTRRAGDRFQPLGMEGHTVRLADFLTNQKVPRAARDRLPLLAAGGEILWVCGWRVDERASVRQGTEGVVILHFDRL